MPLQLRRSFLEAPPVGMSGSDPLSHQAAPQQPQLQQLTSAHQQGGPQLAGSERGAMGDPLGGQPVVLLQAGGNEPLSPSTRLARSMPPYSR